jgi:RNA polymerase sigma-70 factor (ECF subfamily)
MEQGRSERFRRLLEPAYVRAQAFARGLCGSHAEGDDLFQEAALRALTKLDQLRDDDAFRFWLFRIVITVHRNRARGAFWRRLLPLGDHSDDAPPVTDLYRTGEWSPESAEATRRARAALAVLPAVQREAIVLFELEDWQIDEIAELQRVSISAVKSRLSRGRERLRAYYGRHLEPIAQRTPDE